MLKIDKWCIAHPGVPRKVHNAKPRLPSAYIYMNFDIAKVVVCRENTDDCLRALFVNSLAVLDGISFV